MNLLKIGNEYVNLGKVTSIEIRSTGRVVIRTNNTYYYIDEDTNKIDKLEEILDNMSKATKEKWED
jgi:hypothetical protein